MHQEIIQGIQHLKLFFQNASEDGFQDELSNNLEVFEQVDDYDEDIDSRLELTTPRVTAMLFSSYFMCSDSLISTIYSN